MKWIDSLIIFLTFNGPSKPCKLSNSIPISVESNGHNLLHIDARIGSIQY